MATKTTARPPRPGPSVTVLHGIGFDAYQVRGPWWIIKTRAANRKQPTAIVSGHIHRDQIRAELAAYTDVYLASLAAESAWEGRKAA